MLRAPTEPPGLVSPVPRGSGRHTTIPPPSSSASSVARTLTRLCFPDRDSTTTTGGLICSFDAARSRTSGTVIPFSTRSEIRSISTPPVVCFLDVRISGPATGSTSPSRLAQPSRRDQRRAAASIVSRPRLPAERRFCASSLASWWTGRGSSFPATSGVRHMSSREGRRFS